MYDADLSLRICEDTRPISVQDTYHTSRKFQQQKRPQQQQQLTEGETIINSVRMERIQKCVKCRDIDGQRDLCVDILRARYYLFLPVDNVSHIYVPVRQ